MVEFGTIYLVLKVRWTFLLFGRITEGDFALNDLLRFKKKKEKKKKRGKFNVIDETQLTTWITLPESTMAMIISNIPGRPRIALPTSKGP